MKSKTEKSCDQNLNPEPSLNSPGQDCDLEFRLDEIHHQLKSIGETLMILDYDLVDGVHLPGFGIVLCQMAEKVKMIEGRVVRKN